MPSAARTVALSALLCLACGEPFAPTARFVSAGPHTVRIAVAAPAGSVVRLGSAEHEVPDTGVLELDEDLTHYSEVPGLPHVDLRIDPPGPFGGDTAYVSVELPLPLDVIHALPTPEEGVRLLPDSSAGRRIVAVPGSTLELGGAAVPLDEHGFGMLDLDLGARVVGGASDLADGGPLVIPGVLRNGAGERPIAITLELGAGEVRGHLASWLTTPGRAMPEGAAGLLWERREGRRPIVERVGASDVVAMRYHATEEVTGRPVDRCQGGFAMIRDTRHVTVRDLATDAVVAQRDFEPTGRGDCPAVFTLREPDHHFHIVDSVVRAWLEGELARLER